MTTQRSRGSHKVPTLLSLVAGLFVFLIAVTSAHAAIIATQPDFSTLYTGIEDPYTHATATATSTVGGLQFFMGDSGSTMAYITAQIQNGSSGLICNMQNAMTNGKGDPVQNGGAMTLYTLDGNSDSSATGLGAWTGNYSGCDGMPFNAGDTLYLNIQGLTSSGGTYFNAETYAPSDATVTGGGYNSVYPIYFELADANGFAPPSVSFYSQISNLSTTTEILYDDHSTSANQLEYLPEDWVVDVSTSTDAYGNPIAEDGYQWYQVIDPTDGVSGWMEGANASSTIQYLPYDPLDQTALDATSSSFVATSSRPDIIEAAFDHFYNNTDTTNSMYSSDNTPGYLISHLSGNGFPEEVLLGIAAQEDDGSVGGYEYGLNNEDISLVNGDYGFGIMQVTLTPNEGIYSYDNRGQASGIIIPPCAMAEDLYENCYTAADSGVPYFSNYQPYDNDSANPTYEYYANTPQSIYANIKDGMLVLSDSLSKYTSISTSTTDYGLTFSADDRKTILTTADYNGGDCSYVGNVASNLANITSFFPDATTSDITDLINEMQTVGATTTCAVLHSPGDLSISDPSGNTIGIVNGQGVDDFPFAVYDKTRKFAQILGAQDVPYKYKVVGTANATYGLDITVKDGNQEAVFHARNIPTTLGQVHTYTVNKEALLAGEDNAVTIQVDATEDGTSVKTIQVGANLNGSQFSSDLAEVQAAVPISTTTDASITSTSTPITTPIIPQLISTTTEEDLSTATEDTTSTTTEQTEATSTTASAEATEDAATSTVDINS